MAAGLDQDRHLALVVAIALVDPAEVHHGVHRFVGDLGGGLAIGPIERVKRQRVKVCRNRRAAQVRR